MEAGLFIEWFSAPIDSSRPHDLSALVSWHGRLMVLAWAILIPLGIIGARFFKVLPKQDWPNDLDNPAWWYGHLSLQWSGSILTVIAMFLILEEIQSLKILDTPHQFIGWITIVLLLVQVLGGLLRGSKGGPTYPARDGSWRGDHYDMTKRRLIFEACHKSVGYFVLLTASAAVLAGLWTANAPHWMWMSILVWWFILGATFMMLQRRCQRINTYQAIWGPDASLPGNRTDAGR